MEDWDEVLLGINQGVMGAIPAARGAAATPLTGAMLDICSRHMELPFSGSPQAMARLLDIAILTGNQKAAINLAKKCPVRPLRRWKLSLAFEECWEAAKTALCAGADFQDLLVDYSSNEDIPFPQALFLNSKLEDWQEIRHLLPGCRDFWIPRNLNNRLGEFFLEYGSDDDLKLSLDKIQAAEDAGVDVRCCFVWSQGKADGSSGTVTFGEMMARTAVVSLLDIAILFGQPDWAETCVDRGIELKDNNRPLALHKRVLRGENWTLHVLGRCNRQVHVVPFEAQTAAAAAGRASLKRFWKSEASQKGIVLYQMMVKMLKGKSCPMLLAQEILSYSMPLPKIIDQLDLWERVGDWMATICSRPASVLAAADCNTANVEKHQGMQDNHEAGTLLSIEVLVLFSFLCCQTSRYLVSGNHSWEPWP